MLERRGGIEMRSNSLGSNLTAKQRAIACVAANNGRELTEAEARAVLDLSAQIEAAADNSTLERRDITPPAHTEEFKAELERERARSGRDNPAVQVVQRAQARVGGQGAGGWAARTATAIMAMGGESRAVTSGSVDTPQLIETEVVTRPRPERLIDLFTNRKALEGNAFEYFRQCVLTNNAGPVADNAVKPASVFTNEPIEDRARVIARLSEPVPIRLFADHPQLERWLTAEMAEGVLDRVESQAIAGSGTGENITGLLATAGMTAVPFSTDLPTTLRSAVTMLQLAGVTPKGWVLHPNDAQKIGLLRYQSGGETAVSAGFLLDGYQDGVAGSGNVFGPTTPRVVSASVPEGTAVLADWDQLCLYVREGVRIDVDAGGVLFTKNQAILRAETRVGVGVLRPPSFAVVDLTA